jgi:hypothetical protein
MQYVHIYTFICSHVPLSKRIHSGKCVLTQMRKATMSLGDNLMGSLLCIWSVVGWNIIKCITVCVCVCSVSLHDNLRGQILLFFHYQSSLQKGVRHKEVEYLTKGYIATCCRAHDVIISVYYLSILILLPHGCMWKNGRVRKVQEVYAKQLLVHITD